MPVTRTTVSAALFLAALTPGTAAVAQDAAARSEAVKAKAVAAIEAFTKRAAKSKAMALGRRAWQIVVDHYDEDHAIARKALGFEKKGKYWRQTSDPSKAPNKASKSQLKQTVKAWQATSKKLNSMHRELGLALARSGEAEVARAHLELAILHAPGDKDCHVALGHDNIDGYYGTDEQLEFARRMRAMFAKAKECAALDFAITPLDTSRMPPALAGSGLKFRGGKSDHFEHWVIGSEAEVKASLVWAERALVMVRHLLGDQPLAAQALAPDARAYLAILRTDKQRDLLLQRSPVTVGEYDQTKAKMFSGVSYQENGKWAEWCVCHPDADADRCVGHVMMRCAAQRLNHAMSEGLVHALTWMMCGTVQTHYIQLAHTTSGKREAWPAKADVWRQRLEEELANAMDWPLMQLPRERMDNFRDPVRAKAWSFCVWLLARHHEDWLDLCAALNKPNATEGDVEELFGEALGLDVEEVEAEWRAWATRKSPIGRASGW